VITVQLGVVGPPVFTHQVVVVEDADVCPEFVSRHPFANWLVVVGRVILLSPSKKASVKNPLLFANDPQHCDVICVGWFVPIVRGDPIVLLLVMSYC